MSAFTSPCLFIYFSLFLYFSPSSLSFSLTYLLSISLSISFPLSLSVSLFFPSSLSLSHYSLSLIILHSFSPFLSLPSTPSLPSSLYPPLLLSLPVFILHSFSPFLSLSSTPSLPSCLYPLDSKLYYTITLIDLSFTKCVERTYFSRVRIWEHFRPSRSWRWGCCCGLCIVRFAGKCTYYRLCLFPAVEKIISVTIPYCMYSK